MTATGNAQLDNIITSRQGQDVVEVWQILEQILSELDGAATAEKVAYIKERTKLVTTKLKALRKVL